MLWVFGVLLPLSNAVELPNVFSDNMVFQRDMPIKVWGASDPGETLLLRLGPNEVRTQANPEGQWEAVLPAMPAGGPHELHIEASESLCFTQILIGEVWVCAGQSNMEWPLSKALDSKEVISGANHPDIRLFKVPRRVTGQPTDDVNATWLTCTPDSAREFSLLAYHFGCRLHEKLEVPIGLIDTSWSGSSIEAWIAREGYQSVPDLDYIVARIEQFENQYRALLSSRLDIYERWIRAARNALVRKVPVPPRPDLIEHRLASKDEPTGIFNAMVSPLIPFAMRGVIWYQGEQNLGQGDWYYKKMTALIQGWRNLWDQGDFPFYYVQLAPFCYWGIEAGETEEGDLRPFKLPELWKAQTRCLGLPNTGMVVSTDITNLYEIHPQNKEEVARRLSLWALARTYGFTDLVCSGPLFEEMVVEGDKARIRFTHIGSGLCTRDDAPPDWFEIAGADLRFEKASAKIDGESILVWNRQVPEPAAVRFGWHQSAQPNLMNKEGLPASPFRFELE